MLCAETIRPVLCVEGTEWVGKGIVRIGLVPPPGATEPRPGQFFSVRCGSSTAPLLRRPFSVHRVREGRGGWRLDLLVRVVGPGTRWLGSRSAGDRLDLIGPLGNGFDPDPGVTAVLVARGIGIAPLFALGEALRETITRERLHILMGARYRERIFLREGLSGLGMLHLYTDDGSEGFRGLAPDLLVRLAETGVLGDRFTVYACGPDPMLRELAGLQARLGFDGQAALEAHMGCGFGACLSCAVPLRPQALRRGGAWPDPARRSVLDALKAGDPVVDGHLAVRACACAMESEAGLVRAPTPVLAGSEGFPGPGGLAEAVPDSRTAVPEGGMVPMLDPRPEAFAETVLGFPGPRHGAREWEDRA